MPWKFVTVLVILGLILSFVAFNVNNTSDISFGVYRAENVPIFLSLFIAFFLGFLVTLPFALSSSSKKTRETLEKKRLRSEKKEEQQKKKEQRKRGKKEEPPRLAGGDGDGTKV